MTRIQMPAHWNIHAPGTRPAAARRFFGCVLAMLVKRWGTGLRAELLGREKEKEKKAFTFAISVV
ncbi:hypothetical protein DW876_25575 [Hungatella hathewayi]|jgi:hypothetical protein|nr:hypothetical protein DW876_25575 [Hungatella hathewayi]